MGSGALAAHYRDASELDLRSFLESYGTAGGSFRFLGTPEQASLPGIL